MTVNQLAVEDVTSFMVWHQGEPGFLRRVRARGGLGRVRVGQRGRHSGPLALQGERQLHGHLLRLRLGRHQVKGLHAAKQDAQEFFSPNIQQQLVLSNDL